MTSTRAQAYGRVVRTIEEIGAAKLHGPERELIRHAADTLLFSADVTGDAEALALLDMASLGDHLVHSGRWTREAVERLSADVRGCGPDPAEGSLPQAA